VLLLSPVPMVRGFGVLLVVGSRSRSALTLTAARPRCVRRAARGDGALALAARGRRARRRRGACARARAAAGAELGGVVVRAAVRRPVPVLADRVRGRRARLGGRLADEVVSDVERLVPQDLRAVEDLQALQQATGVAGEIDVDRRRPRPHRPEVVRWMRDYQAGCSSATATRPSAGAGRRSCARRCRCPTSSGRERSASDREQIRALLDAVPPYFSSAVITADRTTANLAFGIRLTSLERQQQIIEDMRDRVNPPDGVTVRLAGLPVLAAEANDALSDPLRRIVTVVVALLAVLLVLLAVNRRHGLRGAWARAWVPVVPIALATGWSALVLWLLSVPLNPLSGDARRARARDLDRVRGAAVGALRG
jgi:predicted RND superfamily exporter protein